MRRSAHRNPSSPCLFLAHQLLLLIDMFLADVASGAQHIDASLAQVVGILLEADVEQRGA